MSVVLAISVGVLIFIQDFRFGWFAVQRSFCPCRLVRMSPEQRFSLVEGLAVTIGYGFVYRLIDFFVAPVQRQMLPERASLTSASVGAGFSSSNARAAIIMPGVQKPH